MDWIYQSLLWYGMLLGMGLVFLPITKRIFQNTFFDGGYAFSKTIGIIIISYVSYVLATIRILPFSTEVLYFLLIAFGLIGYIYIKNKPLSQDQLRMIVIEELLFACAFVAWVFVRGQEPSIHGLEKFMDFGFMNSIARSTYFPPADMWLAGHSINYYYFGHLTGAVLTKISMLPSFVTYNLILATIFGLAIVQVFSLCLTIFQLAFKSNRLAIFGAFLATFIVNIGGNLHTIYLFTKGYPNDNPVPFWQIFSAFNPEKYWYPNATRFIPFTIHEFPIYSYVVADLHGHVFDIPFILLTLALLFNFFITHTPSSSVDNKVKKDKLQTSKSRENFNFQIPIPTFQSIKSLIINHQSSIIYTLILGFLLAIHYMTNAWDLLIYGLLITIIYILIFGITKKFFIHFFLLGITMFIFSLPFSINFSSIVTQIGVNCSPEFLVKMKHLGPFLFEQNNCQVSPPWMLGVLWGFFWINFIFFALYLRFKKEIKNPLLMEKIIPFILTFFCLGTVLIIIPEFFYFKDIYPNHFRANTMFKLGYQAFIMMSMASAFTFFLYKRYPVKQIALRIVYLCFFIAGFCLIAIYSSFAIPSYYGTLQKSPVVEGNGWIKTTYPSYQEIITYLNKVKGQPNILEAQGDSYTDYNVVSAYTGLPTIAGWWVHEWLWRGNSNVVGNLIPVIQTIYEGSDSQQTIQLLKQYKITYIIVGPNERDKYTQLNEEKIADIANLVFKSSDNEGKIYLFKY